jgi:hypothetical protein
MVDSLGLLGETEAHTLGVGLGVNLIPFAIPARLTASWQRVLWGRNTILFQDHFTFGIEGYVPLLKAFGH